MLVRTAPFELTARRIGARQKKKQAPHFRAYKPVRVVRSPQTLHGGRARHVHPKGVNHHFSIQFVVFQLGGNLDFLATAGIN